MSLRIFMLKPAFRILSSLLVPGVLLCPSLHAQQSDAAAASSSKSNGQPVVLPVAVRDKKGALVTSLQKSDLVLTQDGRSQTIQSLTQDASQPLRVGLLFETGREMSGAMEAERKAAESFLDQLLPANSKNQAFLIHFDSEVELLEDFTSSNEKLRQALDDMGSTSSRKGDDRQGPETTDNPNTSARRHGGPQLYDAIFLASDELMKNKDGRKVLIVFSNGGDRGSRETLNDAVDAADRANLTVFTIYFKGQPERTYGSTNFPDSHGGGVGFPGGGGSGYPGGRGGRGQPVPTTSSGVDGRKIMQQI